MQSSSIFSLRVDDPNDMRASLLAMAGWQLVDVTFDPLQQNWVMTFKMEWK